MFNVVDLYFHDLWSCFSFLSLFLIFFFTSEIRWQKSSLSFCAIFSRFHLHFFLFLGMLHLYFLKIFILLHNTII